MYLKCNRRLKDGKEHRYWNIVESKRCAGGKVVQRNVLYLGEINDSQREAWCEVIEAFDEGTQQLRSWPCFPPNGRCRTMPDRTAYRCGSMRCDCIGRASGAHVGWRAFSTSSSDWIGSGPAAYRTLEKARVGATFCRRWYAIG